MNAEILEVVRRHGDGWSIEAQARVDEKAARVESIAAELAAAQTELYAAAALRDWLSNPERGLAFSPGPTSLEPFAGNVRPPEFLAALAADDREKAEPKEAGRNSAA